MAMIIVNYCQGILALEKLWNGPSVVTLAVWFQLSPLLCLSAMLEGGVASENTVWPVALTTSHILQSIPCHGNPFKESVGAP